MDKHVIDTVGAAADVSLERAPADPPHAQTAEYGIHPPGYRLPAETTLGRAKLQVSDLTRSLDYYQNVLGLRVVRRDGDRVALAAHGDDTTLIELQELRGATPVPKRGRLGLYHYAILLPNRAALGSFVAHLAEIGARAGASDHLVSEALYLSDPDGLGIEVYADRPRSTWSHQWRELAMDTKPLDLQSLVEAAGGERWTGMPAGTVIGHIHLHVRDLAQAAAYYHEALGFDKVVWSYPGALFLSAGGYHHHLGVNTWAGASAARPQANDARLLEWEIVLPRREDAERVARSFESSGYATSRDGDDTLATDPWGTTLRLVGR